MTWVQVELTMVPSGFGMNATATNRVFLNAASVCLVAAAFLCAIPMHAQQYNYGPKKDAKLNAPVSNPLTSENVALGKRLFFDARLSDDGWLSCASCHDPAHGFSDPRRFSVGMLGRRSKRHAPTLLGRGLGESEFWDGRAATLEEQVVQPITNPEEMGITLETALERLHRDPAYRGLTRETLAGSLASYLRTLRSEDSHYDLFLSGWTVVMSDLELEGLKLFRGKARCYLCHAGDRFTDESFHNTGVAWSEGTLKDEGRAAITGKSYHRGAFKTPTLRDVARRGPYMHDGSLARLEDVIEFYDRGGNQNPYLDENMAPLQLSAGEKRALLEFLRSGLVGSVRNETTVDGQ